MLPLPPQADGAAAGAEQREQPSRAVALAIASTGRVLAWLPCAGKYEEAGLLDAVVAAEQRRNRQSAAPGCSREDARRTAAPQAAQPAEPARHHSGRGHSGRGHSAAASQRSPAAPPWPARDPTASERAVPSPPPAQGLQGCKAWPGPSGGKQGVALNRARATALEQLYLQQHDSHGFHTVFRPRADALPAWLLLNPDAALEHFLALLCPQTAPDQAPRDAELPATAVQAMRAGPQCAQLPQGREIVPGGAHDEAAAAPQAAPSQGAAAAAAMAAPGLAALAAAGSQPTGTQPSPAASPPPPAPAAEPHP